MAFLCYNSYIKSLQGPHLGVKKITAIGYDLSDSKIKKVSEHKHFFGDTNDLINRGDVLGWEMGANIEASESAYRWLKEKGIEFLTDEAIDCPDDNMKQIFTKLFLQLVKKL